ncbi:hypothetical protein HMPREF1870_01635 [Bacteroidales bacterium KA00344]|nr:hypothetical protein HMPREF1870_01635 [Bacteroidales bacterium KA00344]
MRDLQPTILDDFEHRVNLAIEHHQDEQGFPCMEDFNVTREELDEFLFDYQAILDSEGSQRSQQTTYGIIALIPIIVLSAFPQKSLPWDSPTTSLLAGVAIGVAIALAVKGIRMFLKSKNIKRQKAEHPDVVAYINAVLSFEQHQ